MADEALTAGAVARRLGVAVTTLRTWHQRYGLGPSHHVPGHHRRYTVEDLARLEIMRRLTAEGIPPAEAARWAKRTAVPPLPSPSASSPSPAPFMPSVPSPPVPSPLSADGPDAPAPGRQAARHGGGNTIPLGRVGPVARGLARAAMSLDVATMREILERSIATTGVVATWDDVIVPVLIGIGQRHAVTNQIVEVEHLASRTVSEVLGAVPRPPAGSGPTQVLLACADEEQHTLALEALAAALAEAGTACRLLGARVPPDALSDAIERTGPTVVVIWSQLPPTADPAQLTRLLTGPRRPLLVMAAGPGWYGVNLPAEVAVPGGLGEAAAITLAAVEPTQQAG